MNSLTAVTGGSRTRRLPPQPLASSSTAQPASLVRSKPLAAAHIHQDSAALSDADAEPAAGAVEAAGPPPQVLMPSPPTRPASAARVAQLATARGHREAAESSNSVAESAAELEQDAFEEAGEAWRTQSGKRKRGQAVTRDEAAAVLNANLTDVEGHEEERHSWRLRLSVAITGLSLKTARKIVNEYFASYELPVEDVAKRGGGSDQEYALPDGIGEEVVKWVDAVLNDDSGPQWVLCWGCRSTF